MRVRVLLDTNVWSFIADDDSGTEWNEISEANGLEIVLAPSVLVEVLRLPPADVRGRVIETMARGPRRRRLAPEAYLESMEIVKTVKKHRPGWVRQVSNPAVVAKHLNFWTKGIWREALFDSTRLHQHLSGQSVGRELTYLTDTQRAQRRELLQSNVTLSPVSDLVATAIPGANAELLRGWSGDAVPAWRVSLRDLYWHQLVVVGDRSALTGEDTTYLDWIGAHLDRSKIRDSPENFTSMWLNEVALDEVRRNWIRWAVSTYQLDTKVTGGNPVDEQHSAYLLECDEFVTADRAFARILERVRDEAPFELCNIRQIAAADTLSTARRLAAALGL